MNAIILDDFLKEIVEAMPLVASYTGNDVYDEWNNKEIKYASVAFNVDSVSIDDNVVIYNGILYYGDRLNEDNSNAKSIQSDAATTLTNIIEYVNGSVDYINIDFPVDIKLFEQTFADKLAGGYANVEITVENDLLECGYVNKVKETLNIIENGVYNVTGYDFVNIDVEGSEGGSKDPNSVGAFDGMTKINDYLYSISYSNIDYKDAIKHFESLTSENSGACSFIREGNKIGRNFDWTINNQVEFLVKTQNTGKHYSVTGIVSIEGITTNNIDEYSEDFKYLPFRLLDGINERGLVCSVNQLPQSYKTISKDGTAPSEELKETISMFMLTRYVLDNFDSALVAADYIKKYVKVMPILDKSGNALDFHYCIADKDNTVYLYFENAETKYEEKANNKFVMTNFRLADTSLIDGHYSVTDSNIEEFGQGIERANSLIDNFDLDEVVFTKAYTTTDRLTDFAGIEGATISNTDKLTEIQARAAAKFDQEQAAGSLRTSADLW